MKIIVKSEKPIQLDVFKTRLIDIAIANGCIYGVSEENTLYLL